MPAEPGHPRRILIACAATVAATVLAAAAVAQASGDPTLRLTAADQRKAKEVVHRSHDFPSAWRYQPLALRGLSIDATCTGLHVDLSRLVITGQSGSRVIHSRGSLAFQDVVTEAFRLATQNQAETIQARLPASYMHACIGAAGTHDGHGGRIASVSRLNWAAPGLSVVAYRVHVTSSRRRQAYGDYLFLQAHRTWVTVFYTSTPQPPAFDQEYLATLAGRIRSDGS